MTMRRNILRRMAAGLTAAVMIISAGFVQTASGAEQTAAEHVYTVTANLYVPGELNTQLPGVTAYMTNPDNPLGIVPAEMPNGHTFVSAAPTVPVEENAELTVAADGSMTLDLLVPNPVFTLQSIGGGTNAEILDIVRDDQIYAVPDNSVSRNGRITDLTIALKDRSGKYIFSQCTEFPTLLGVDWTVPLTLQVDFSTVPEEVPGTLDTPDVQSGFSDIPDGAWYAEAVSYVKENGLMNGVSADRFGGTEKTTRGMIVTILYRLAGSPSVAAQGEEWYAEGQSWAVAQGISDGSSMTGNITREQLVTMLWRYAGGDSADEGGLSSYADVNELSDFARQAMSWAIEKGVISGSDGGRLNPKGNATRAELAAVLMRFHKL